VALVMNILPINLDDLIHARSIETVRREFKKSWSDHTLSQTIRTITAFANDFFNLNGGYIVLGIEEHNGMPVLPPSGLEAFNIDEIQKQIRGNCKRIDPEYQPILSPELFQGKQILVIWAPAGEVRPYQAPESVTTEKSERKYYVRQGAETVAARSDILTQLISMTAKVPFDDRRNMIFTVDVISPTLVRNYLSDVKSDLVAPGVTIQDLDLYRYLRISVKVNGHEAPKNVALLFFVNEPEVYFPGTKIEVVQFDDDTGGDLIEEKTFRGPLHVQIRQALDYLESFSTTIIRKVPNQAEAYRTVAFPYEAMEEAVVNAAYHRSYDGIQEPIKVYLYPDRMEIISYPGPVPGIELRHLQPGSNVPPVPSRNRRIGEFLKELRLAEGRGTGIPKIRRKMRENGSPEPLFEFDEPRTYFRVTLPAHPQYVVLHALRGSAHLWAVGDRQRAITQLENIAQHVPNSGSLIAQIMEYKASVGDVATAEALFNQHTSDLTLSDRHLPYLAMAKIYLDQRNLKRAADTLTRIPSPTRIDDLIELAVLYKRSGNLKDAHSVFASNYDLIKDNAKAVHEYAQTKSKLASTLSTRELTTKKRLTRDAIELYRRAIQLSADDNVRMAWCYYDLAKALAWLREPETEILQAYTKAVELLPHETRFTQWHASWRARISRSV
jgi:ATP-dependent DNA helicase RecG